MSSGILGPGKELLNKVLFTDQSAPPLDVISPELGPLAVLIGMTAGLSALTQSPLTSFIIILEMTDRHSANFPLMIASFVEYGLSKRILKKPFYEFVSEKIFSKINQGD